jgi:hypothetical protein
MRDREQAPHKKIKGRDERISRAAKLVVKSRIHLDYFVFFNSPTELAEFEDVLGIYWDFFRFSRLSHEWAFYLRITNLLTSKTDTDNLPELLKELERDQAISQELSAKAHATLSRIDPTRKAIKHIRNKAVAHQDDTLSQPEVYSQAHLNPPALIEISDASLDVANCLCIARGLPKEQFVTGHIDRLRAMLEALRASPMRDL